jgi:hypothetical protein
MAKSPVVRAVQIAAPMTLLLVGTGMSVLVAMSQRTVNDDVIVDFIAGTIVLSVFAFPLVFVAAWASLHRPGLLKRAMLWPTILLGLLTLWWLFDDLRHGRTFSLDDIAKVWMILWPIAVAISFARQIGRAGGQALVATMREKWTERRS